MKMNRRQALASISAGIASTALGCNSQSPKATTGQTSTSLKLANGDVDWGAVRQLFPLATDWTHLASFIFVSHPKPVADAIAKFRARIDADPLWIEDAAFTDSEGRPFALIKKSLAEYVGGKPEEICLTSNTTTGLALAWHGLRIRPDQHVVTTEHDHYVHHECIRMAMERTGAATRYVSLYDNGSGANVSQMAERLERAITPQTRAVGITWVHSSTGVRTPVPEIAEVVARANRGRAAADRCLLIVDGVHGFANQDVDIAKLGADFFASGTHKWLFAPRGTGFLWGKAESWPELRPTIPNFDPDGFSAWESWGDRKPFPTTTAALASPGGFYAYEHWLAVPTAVELHKQIGRDKIAARIRELNTMFREGAAKIKGVTLHTPSDPGVSGGISCFEVAGVTAADFTAKLIAKKIRTNNSPYKVSYARVAGGVMNTPAEIETVLREISLLAK